MCSSSSALKGLSLFESRSIDHLWVHVSKQCEHDQFFINLEFCSQVCLGIHSTNIFAIMRDCHMTLKSCTAVTREPGGPCLLKKRPCSWTSTHTEGQCQYGNTHSPFHLPLQRNLSKCCGQCLLV